MEASSELEKQPNLLMTALRKKAVDSLEAALKVKFKLIQAAITNCWDMPVTERTKNQMSLTELERAIFKYEFPKHLEKTVNDFVSNVEDAQLAIEELQQSQQQ